MKRTERYVFALVLILAFSAALWAQGTAQISGAIRDQSGAVLPGVEITATQTETGISRTATAAHRVERQYGSAKHRRPGKLAIRSRSVSHTASAREPTRGSSGRGL